jgi:hypothetical protein
MPAEDCFNAATISAGVFRSCDVGGGATKGRGVVGGVASALVQPERMTARVISEAARADARPRLFIFLLNVFPGTIIPPAATPELRILQAFVVVVDVANEKYISLSLIGHPVLIIDIGVINSLETLKLMSPQTRMSEVSIQKPESFFDFKLNWKRQFIVLFGEPRRKF